MIFVVCSCFAFMVITYFINALCLILAPVALFVILFYSYTKRFTSLMPSCVGLGLKPFPYRGLHCSYRKFAFLPVLFSLSVLFWVSGFDIIYALQDEEFDKESITLHTFSAWQKRAFVSELLHVLSFASFLLPAYWEFRWFYWAGAAIIGYFIIYQHTLVKPKDLSRVNRAFFTSNGIASVIFSLFVLIIFIIKFIT